MAQVEVTIPDRIDSEIARLVEQGEFLNREEAMEELLTRGVSAYTVTEADAEEPEAGEMAFSETVEEQQDPAARDDPGPGDEYTF